MSASPSNVFIFGSCVSRDSFEFLPEDEFSLLSYIARQSLISSFAAPARSTVLPKESGLTSSFQRRMLQGDLESSLPRQIDQWADQIDLIICDFVDERGGVLIHTSGDVITDSLALQKSGILDSHREDFRIVSFGSDEHFDMWKTAFDQFVALVAKTGLLDKTVLIRNKWALETVEGEIFPLEQSRMQPQVINGRYVRYFEYASSVSSILVVDVPVFLCVSTDTHKWGPAPFHYARGFYKYVVQQVREKAVLA